MKAERRGKQGTRDAPESVSDAAPTGSRAIVARRPAGLCLGGLPLKDLVRTTFAAARARAYGEQHGRGLLYQCRGPIARPRWARELTRPGRLEAGLRDRVCLRDGLWWSVYLTLARLRDAGAPDIPVIAGGIIPQADARALIEAGVAAVFTPKDFGITEIIGRIVDEIRKANKLDPLEVPA